MPPATSTLPITTRKRCTRKHLRETAIAGAQSAAFVVPMRWPWTARETSSLPPGAVMCTRKLRPATHTRNGSSFPSTIRWAWRWMAAAACISPLTPPYPGEVLKETPTGKTYKESTIPTLDVFGPDGIAVDGNADVDIASAGSLVRETPSGSTYTQSTVSDLGAFGVAVDQNGDVYVSLDYGNAVFKETPTADGYVESLVPTSPLSKLNFIGVDVQGNLYIPTAAAGTAEARLLRVNFADASSLSFSTTYVAPSSAPQTVTVQNIGNEGLRFLIPDTGTNPSVSANFMVASDNVSDCPQVFSDSAEGEMVSGASCLLPISFTPTSSTGSVTGWVLLTDDALNVSGATQTIALSGNAADQILGIVSMVGDSSTGGTTIAQSDSLVASGYAADALDGAPASEVTIFIDGTTAGNATLGVANSTLAESRNNPKYLNAGWTFTQSASGLALGAHTVSVTAYGPGGISKQIGSVSITVATRATTGPPFGSLGSAVDATTGTTAVVQSDNLLVTGWAADPKQRAPVSMVTLLIDGAAAGNATLGIALPNVAAMLHNSAYLDCGWTFSESAIGLAHGAHTVTAVAYDSSGLSTML